MTGWKSKKNDNGKVSHFKDEKKIRDSEPDINVEININTDELEDFANEKKEEPEEYYSDRLDRVIEDLQEETKSYSAKLTETSGMNWEGIGHLTPLINDIEYQIGLELENIDWQYILEENGERGLHRELTEVKERLYEHEMYWLDKEFGYDEPTEYDRPKNKGEELAQKLFEPFDRMKDEELSKYATREADYAKSKKIIQDTLDHVFDMAQKDIPRE